MGSKTISLSDEAYARLKALKRPNESFSDTINRLTGRMRLSEIAGVLHDEDIEAIERAVALVRDKSRVQLSDVDTKSSD
jgi:predicted CopG family antitoxin